jgi:hypothetical protein
MKRHFTRIAFAVICLAAVCSPLAGQKGGKPGGGGGGSTGSTACATVATPTLSTATAAPGLNVGIFSRVINCSSGRSRYTVTISAVSSCGEETIVASSLITFNGGEAKLISVSYPIAPDTCRGVSSVFVNVYSGGSLLASQSTPLTIQ